MVEADDLLRDPAVWNRMHFGDWDRVPEPLRREAVERMIARYLPLLAGPHVWEAMRAEDGDFVPQPLRAMAFIRIAEHWAEYYEVGVGSGLDPQDTSGTLATIIMVESWFEHRAVHVDEDGNLDLAMRAYRKGISPAQAGGAEAYLENVKRKRERYVQGRSPSPTWAFSSVTRVGAALGSRLRGPMKQRRDGGANERLPSEWARHGTAAPRCTPH